MPGETYQTRKFKATQQAKKSGLVGQAAENYGTAMASQSAVVGRATGDEDFMGYARVREPSIQKWGSTENVQQQIEARQAAEKKMQEEGGVYNPQTGQVIYPEKKDDIFQTIQNEIKAAAGDAGTMFGLLPNILKGALEGPQATSNFFKKLASGKPLDDEDKIILANLMAADKRGANVFGETVLDDWMEKFDVTDKKGFKSSLDDAKKDLESGVKLKSGETISYEDLIKKYETGQPTGLGGIFGLGEGERTGGITREELKKTLGPEGLAYLKANDPAKYYSFIDPQTTDSLGELANLHVTKEMQGENKDLVRKIFEARQTLGTEKLRQDQAGQEGGRLWGPGGAGIADLPGIPPDLVQQPITTQPDLSDVVLGYGPGEGMAYTGVMPQEGHQYAYDEAGRRYEIPIGGDQSGTTYGGNPFTFREGEPWQAPVGDKFTTAAATTATPFDYSQWPQFTSAYPGHYSNWGAPSYAANGGVVSQARPQYDYWNKIANAFPGMR